MRSLSYTISARGKRQGRPLRDYLAEHFAEVPMEAIDSVFGFAEPCTLYGGRPFFGRELSDGDIAVLYDAGIGLRLPLSTHAFTDDEYVRARPFLEQHHREGNSLIVFHDALARRLRDDFPRYALEASVIKNIATHARIAQALELYDTVVLPMALLDDPAFLAAVAPKDRIRLFATVGCAYNCPAHTCYPNVSRSNKLLCSGNPLLWAAGLVQFPFTVGCSRSKRRRAKLGMKVFDVEPFVDLGYSRFKLMRSHAIRKSCR